MSYFDNIYGAREFEKTPIIYEMYLDKLLNDENWTEVVHYCDKLLEEDIENGIAYLGKFLAEYKIKRVEQVEKLGNKFYNNINFKYAVILTSNEISRKLRFYECRAKKKASDCLVRAVNIFKYAVRFVFTSTLIILINLLYADGLQLLGNIFTIVLIIVLTIDVIISKLVLKSSKNEFITLISYAGAPITLISVTVMPIVLGYSVGNFIYVMFIIAIASIFISLALFLYKHKKLFFALTLGGGTVVIAGLLVFLFLLSPVQYALYTDGTAGIADIRSTDITRFNILEHYYGRDVVYIDQYAFEDCDNFKEIKLPDTVVYIGDGAFKDCTNLETINLSNNVTYIGRNAFYNCSKLETINFDGTMSEWNAIRKNLNWDKGTGEYAVSCTNGVILGT